MVNFYVYSYFSVCTDFMPCRVMKIILCNFVLLGVFPFDEDRINPFGFYSGVYHC